MIKILIMCMLLGMNLKNFIWLPNKNSLTNLDSECSNEWANYVKYSTNFKTYKELEEVVKEMVTTIKDDTRKVNENSKPFERTPYGCESFTNTIVCYLASYYKIKNKGVAFGRGYRAFVIQTPEVKVARRRSNYHYATCVRVEETGKEYVIDSLADYLITELSDWLNNLSELGPITYYLRDSTFIDPNNKAYTICDYNLSVRELANNKKK